MSTPAFTITNEQQFIEMISKLAKAENIDTNDFLLPDIEFQGFPTLKFNVKGEHYSSTLTTFLLKALNELTIEIQRSYCFLKYETTNLRRLTDDDYQNIDIIFKIREGSSEGESDNSSIAKSIVSLIKSGMQGMNGWQKLATLLAMMGTLGFLGDKYLENQNLESERATTLTKTAIKEVSHVSEEALKLVREKGSNYISKEIDSHTQSAQQSFFKEISKDNSVKSAEINNEVANREQLNEYKKRLPIPRDKQTRTDEFLIKTIDFYAPTYIETDVTISVIRLTDDEQFNLKTSFNLMSEKEINRLKFALGINEYVKITYEEIKENGKIVQSQFVRVEF